MFIQTEATPNPATLKFLPGRQVAGDAPIELRSAEQAEKISPLARALFDIEGVTNVYLGSDFISITQRDRDWAHVKPQALGLIMEHFLNDAPVFAHGAASQDQGDGEFFNPDDAPVVAQIKELLETRVRPAVAGDGGDIRFRGFEKGVVYLTMQGACSGCPSSTATLKNGIQNLLRHFVPEVQSVEQAQF